MRIETDTNLLFDSTNPQCYVIKSCANGYTFGFVQCLDIGTRDNRHDKPHIKRYWGALLHDDYAYSIKKIMENGGKWPQLPAWPLND